MRKGMYFVSLFSILSFSLISLTGCGEKQIHVASLSDTAGEEGSASSSDSDTLGLPDSSPAEPPLTWQGSFTEEVRADVIQPIDPVNFNHDPAKPAQDTSRGTGTPSAMDSGSAKGSNIATQSRSSTESIPDNVQVAKTEPSDMLREQLDTMKGEELATTAAGIKDVFFPFDSWSFTTEAKESLEGTLKWLTNEHASLLVIEGYADQRGTQSYNMVLGKRRAMAIHNYLFQLGIDPSRLSVVSYGKDKPFCLDPTEVCYQLNRRGHLLIQK